MQTTYPQQSFSLPPSYNPPGTGQVQQQAAPTALHGPAAQQSRTPHDYYQIPQGEVTLNPVQYVTVCQRDMIQVIGLLELILSCFCVRTFVCLQLSDFQMPSVAVAQPQNNSAPPDFLILAVIATIVCAILNVVSLAFGVSAVIFSTLVSLLANLH